MLLRAAIRQDSRICDPESLQRIVVEKGAPANDAWRAKERMYNKAVQMIKSGEYKGSLSDCILHLRTEEENKLNEKLNKEYFNK